MRLVRHYEEYKGTLFVSEDVKRVIDDIYKYPFRESAKDLLNRRLRMGISDEDLTRLVKELRSEGRLCDIKEDSSIKLDAPQIICSMGIRKTE